MPGPIADLSYRHYEGVLESPVHRWWAIAKMMMRVSWTRQGAWTWKTLAVLSAFWYIVLSIVYYVVETLAQNAPLGAGGVQNAFFKQLVWKDQFLNAFGMGQLGLMLVTLSIGAGAIANDNRANALLVYLSKPCTKLDYLIGKWMGIFIPLGIISLAPTVLFYGYCFMSYRSYGFYTQDPWLFPKVVTMALIPAVFHASLAVGISSLFVQGRLAGATYAGIYFMTYFLTFTMLIIRGVTIQGGGDVPAIENALYYCSIDGIQIGMAKIVLGTDGSPLFISQIQNQKNMIPPEPNALYFVPLFFGIAALFVWLAWTRIRAVEVVA